MLGPIAPAQLALCAVIELYLRKSEEGDSDEDELDVVQVEQRVRLGPLLTRVLQPGAAGDSGSPDLLGAEAKIVDVLALLQRDMDGVLCRGTGVVMEGADAGGVWLETVPASVLSRVRRLDSPDALVDFFGRVAAALRSNRSLPPDEATHEQADDTSVLGVALRRCLLAFDSLPFEGVCALYGAIQDELAALSAEDFQEALQRVLPLPSSADSIPAGSPQQQREDSATEADQAGAKGSSLGADAEAAEAKTRRRHFRRHQQALQERDLLVALESLHKHFDYNADGGEGAEVGDGDWAGAFQNALLSLAAMHAHFGHSTQALTALNETVRVAQQAGDAACLAHALAALCGLLANTTPAPPAVAGAPPPPPHLHYDNQLRRLLRVCLRQGQELGLPHLAAFARLGLARAALQGGTVPPPAIWRDPQEDRPAAPAPTLEVAAALQEVQQLHFAAATAAAAPSRAPPPRQDPASAAAARAADLFGSGTAVFGPALQGCEAATAAAVEELAGSSHLLAGAAWRSAASPDLAAVAAATRIACYAGPHQQRSRPGGSAAGRAEAGSAQQEADVALAYAQLAMLAHERRGPKAAVAVLAKAEATLPGCDAPALAAARLTIGHSRALAHGHLEQARDLASELSALAATTADADAGLQAAADAARTRQAIGEARYKEAVVAANEMFAACHAAALQAGCVEALLLSAEAHRAARLPTSALPYTLSALHHARRLSLDALAAQAVVALADIWLALGPQHAGRAASEVRSVLPIIAAQGGLRLRAEAHAVLARAQLTAAPPEALQNTTADMALTLLVEAASSYEVLEDFSRASEQRHLAALVADAAGQPERRHFEAAAWAQLRDQAEAAFDTRVVNQ